MICTDPGHFYVLDSIDGEQYQSLSFVKREGPGYPGNVGHHPGTNLQEVLRALIDRCNYLSGQAPCPETTLVISLLESAIYLLEVRAACRHGRTLTASLEEIVSGASKCAICGHVGCDGDCRPHKGESQP